MNSTSDSLPQILGLSGSLRREAYSTAILRTLKETVSAIATVNEFPLHDIPLYNADNDGENTPESVRKFKAAIAECRGLIVVSPEYNYGTSGVLKNALDWASRPAYRSVLKDKVVLIITNSTSYAGGVRAHAQLASTFAGTLSWVVPRPQVTIPFVNQKVNDGRLVDEPTLKVMVEAVGDLLRAIQRSIISL